MLGDFRELEGFLARCTNYERLQTFNYDKYTLGLERMLELALEIGAPHRDFRAVHIAGTKGKGSTSLILEALLLAEGFDVGTYTSPHVEHLRERIRVGGEPVSEDALVREVNRMLPSLESRQRRGPSAFPSFFELMTAVAMAHFSRMRVDWGVIEVGLGGRLDATNILEPRLTAITSIGLEHTQLLGDTLEKIACEKAGIIKPGIPVVLGPLLAEALDAILAIAAERSAPVIRLDESLVEPVGSGEIRVAGREVIPAGPIIGPAMRTDLALALTLFRQILEIEGRPFRADVLRDALASVRLPARVERFPGDPEVILDAAHTADSIRALRLTLEEIAFPSPRTLVFSIATGKDLAHILGELPRIADEIIFTLADPARSVPPAKLRETLGSGDVIESPKEALDEALRRGRPVVVTGSFYLAGALRPLVRRNEAPASAAAAGVRASAPK
jgi:dihydrofolate synthase/folylpolyglutamate synthase